MAKAETTPITGLRLSQLFRDPFLKATFERAERDGGASPVLSDYQPVLPGGQTERVLA